MDANDLKAILNIIARVKDFSGNEATPVAILIQKIEGEIKRLEAPSTAEKPDKK